jgi:pimeloyl-ACP methyl ester carboxylesterase
VLFVTDRREERGTELATRFGSGSEHNPGEITCGKVNFSPQLADREPGDYQALISLGPERLPRGLRACVDFVRQESLPESSAILFFIHGYNNKFEDSLRRAVGVAHSLRIPGPIVTWSWPSYGATKAYFDDGKVVNWSAPHVAAFLSELHGSLLETKIHLIAHSMGSRILLQILNHLAQDAKTRNVRSIVFAAGDVGQADFKREINGAYVTAAAGGTSFGKSTIYASASDSAIGWSEFVNGNNRIGSGGRKILILDEAESIDVDLPGHAYVFDHPRGVLDLSMLVVDGKFADARLHLQRRTASPKVYWLLKAN